MRILSIDWDYFFPELSFDPQMWMLYDWGHRDGGSMFLNQLWYDRAVGFISNNLPLPGLSGDQVDFWKRFTFQPWAKLWVSESHAHIYHPDIQNLLALHLQNSIDNFDAHHDAGYRGTIEQFVEKGEVSCENWALGYSMNGIKTRTFYPKWKTWAVRSEHKPLYKCVRRFDKGEVIKKPYDHIFICRSGGWTPPWLDGEFEKFVAECPVKEPIPLVPCENRQWSQERLDQYVSNYKTMRDQLTAQMAT